MRRCLSIEAGRRRWLEAAHPNTSTLLRHCGRLLPGETAGAELESIVALPELAPRERRRGPAAAAGRTRRTL